MKLKSHLRVLVYASIAWFLFWVAGLPDYYLQYSTTTLIWFDVLLLIPFSIVIWFVFKPIKTNKRVKVSFWYAFYFTVPLAVYDYIYCGIYLGYGFDFVPVFWFLSVYYLILWILFPIIAILLNSKKAE